MISRNQEGTFLEASTFVFRFISDPSTLEALALTKNLYIQSIQVGSDCKVVIDDIQKRSSASYDAIVQEIIDLLVSFTSCNFVYEHMSINFEAYNLTKHALILGNGRHIWLDHLKNLSSVT